MWPPRADTQVCPYTDVTPFIAFGLIDLLLAKRALMLKEKRLTKHTSGELEA